MSKKEFPENFIWGVSTSAYQVEGKEDRGVTTWDVFAKKENAIADKSDGTVACEHIKRYHEDVALIQKLGAKGYRTSVAWARVQPNSSKEFKLSGLDFYKKLANELLQVGITPSLCLNHWDVPQWFEDAGGWSARGNVNIFVDYADFVTRELGNLVKIWHPHNEPNVVAFLGYGWGLHAPGETDRNLALAAAHHLNLSHGLATQAIRANFADLQIAPIVTMQPIVGGSSEEDIEWLDQLWNRCFTDPVILGSYPDKLAAALAPWLKNDDLINIKQPIDFFGCNHYTAMRAAHGSPLSVYITKTEAGLPVTDMGWEVNENYYFQQLMEFKTRYGNIPVLATENGCAYPDTLSENNEIHDTKRIEYYSKYLSALHRAIENGVKVLGYYAWSLIDNFEWSFGYTKRFGLVYVNYENQERIPKDSFNFMKKIYNSNALYE